MAKVLGYKQPDRAVRDHCKAAHSSRVNRPTTSGGNPNVTIIPERDVYRLVMRSKLPAGDAVREHCKGAAKHRPLSAERRETRPLRFRTGV